ncbi:LysR substrate-binding domain-containing protein [Pseudoalteromonas fenneropenaei]|uniref:LysR substrate-binding domain-containing protein n=1 Tax=Pseudoalteromonas fenneropenaei TaxID=1737459 RepID=A0ABV7CJ02_9GAMM
MIDNIQIFLTVVEQGSFSKAGAVLGMAPSSVARNIEKLEQHFALTLFTRSTRALTLTEKGEQFIAGAEQMLQHYQQLHQLSDQTQQTVAGRLRISVLESFGRLWIAPLVTEFLTRFPEVQIDLALDNQVQDLYSGNIDLAIRIGTLADSSLIARKLVTNHTLLVAAPSYIAKYGQPTTPNDLEAHNCLCLNRGRQNTYWHFQTPQQTLRVQVKGNLTSAGGTPLLQAAIQGLGVAQLTSWMVQTALQQGELQQLLPAWRVSLNDAHDSSIYAVYVKQAFPNPLLRAFLDFLVEQLQSELS